MRHDHGWKATEVKSIRTALLQWYDKRRRCLPWRGDFPPFLTPFEEKGPDYVASATVSPYGTWVSEIMCQQTRVETVVDYYVRWMEKFPTVHALAAAEPEQVNAAWAGLGYYRRARMLHDGAKYVVETYDGEMPNDIDRLKAIPGIGPYTAGAIASVAFGVPAPLVDGNVIRVVSRLRAVGADPKHKPLIDHCWESGAALIDPKRPGDFNQALMELGARLCSIQACMLCLQIFNFCAQNPSCETCPVQAHCHAYAESQKPPTKSKKAKIDCLMCDMSRLEEWGIAGGEVTQYPLKTRKKAPRNEALNILVITTDDEDGNLAYLMTKRPEGGLLAGQWEFPAFKISDDDEIPSYKARQDFSNTQLMALFDLTSMKAIEPFMQSREDKGELVHIFSHVKHHMGVEHVALVPSKDFKALFPPVYTWMTAAKLAEAGITTGMKKVMQLLEKTKPAKKTKAPREPASRKVKCKVEPSAPITSFFKFAAKTEP
ncbi:A/G-specific adenine DNA glycosylase-like isoform X1 [Achlya hypogyna]|uniref:Adenine DNA glycosylase n=1 Tax=Achlya hypogyna TaxID=1202772 RepID=A0A1V9ZA94_ACHHY|nr:A/G-specific adenine DNA glycosylase-like isoform X1 [Achlya hypogyna]